MRNRLKTISVFFAVLFLIGSSVFAQTKKPTPNFSLLDLNQKKVALNDYKDKQPVVLLFWTTWCPFCRTQLKALNDKYPQILSDGVRVLAINVGETEERIRKFITSNKYPFSVLLDKDSSVAQLYEVLGIPSYVLVDKEGYALSEGNSFPDYKKLLK